MPAGIKTVEINEKTGLLRLAWPLFFEQLLNVLLHNVDTMMLSHYSENAVGAVGNVAQILTLMMIIFGVISLAASVTVAQYLGAKEYGRMNQIYTLGVVVNLVAGIILSAGVVFFGEQILSLMNVPAEMVEPALKYLNITGGTMFTMSVFLVLQQYLRTNGFPKAGLYMSIVMNVINIGGNYLFLYGPWKHLDYGVTGVAISTAAARVAALAVALFFFYKMGIGRLSLKYLVPFPGKLLAMMTKIGLPSAGEQLSYSLYQTCFVAFINTMGEASVNARIYAFNLITFTHLFSLSTATATQIIVGHLVGAGKEDAAYKRVFRTMWLSVSITTMLTVLNWLLGPYTLSFFTNDAEIIRLGCQVLLVDILLEIGRCLNLTFIFSMRAAGDYLFPLIIGLITMWGVGLPSGYLIGVTAGVGVAGVFVGTALDECVRGLVVAWYWYKRKWCGKKLC